MLGLITGQFLLVIVAAFIFLGAGAESMEGRARTVLAAHRVGDAYNRGAITLHADDRIGRVIDYILNSYQPDFAVTDGPNLIGIVTRNDVVRALAQGVGDVPVREIMSPANVRVSEDQTLEDVREAMTEKGSRLAAVYDGSRYLGLLSNDDLEEALAILQFVNGHRRGNGAAMHERPRDGGVVV
jgi:CBS domain-containing protein